MEIARAPSLLDQRAVSVPRSGGIGTNSREFARYPDRPLPPRSMRTLSIAAVAIALAAPAIASAQYSSLAPAVSSTVTIHAARMIDGRGKETANVLVTVRDGRIVGVAPAADGSAKATYELGDATLLPGLIDAHVHPGW